MRDAPRTTAPVVVFAAIAVSAALGCFPEPQKPDQDVEKLQGLKQVMDAQSTAADPQFGKIGRHSHYTEDDFSAFANVSTRIKATSSKAKQFSKGPEFDALIERLNGNAEELGRAAQSHDGEGASKALELMRRTCKDCHTIYRTPPTPKGDVAGHDIASPAAQDPTGATPQGSGSASPMAPGSSTDSPPGASSATPPPSAASSAAPPPTAASSAKPPAKK